MFDIGWQELFLIGVVALVVVGPKDLPKVLRSTARVLNKARAMSREFQAGLAEMAREAELDEIKRNVERTNRFDLGEELKNSIDPTGKFSAELDPAEFNRKLEESVEASPPASCPRPPVPKGIRSPPAAREPVPEDRLGDGSPADVTGRPTSLRPTGEDAAKRGSGPAHD